MSAFRDLLIQAGNQPDKNGRRWSCVTCPEGKSPALSVDLAGERFYCHRCGRGGGIGMLRKNLWIAQDRPWTRAERSAYAQRRVRARQQADDFLTRFHIFRESKLHACRGAHFVQLLCQDLFEAAVAAGEPVSDFVIDLAYLSARDMEELGSELNVIEDPDELSAFAELFRRRAA